MLPSIWPNKAKQTRNAFALMAAVPAATQPLLAWPSGRAASQPTCVQQHEMRSRWSLHPVQRARGWPANGVCLVNFGPGIALIALLRRLVLYLVTGCCAHAYMHACNCAQLCVHTIAHMYPITFTHTITHFVQMIATAANVSWRKTGATTCSCHS